MAGSSSSVAEGVTEDQLHRDTPARVERPVAEEQLSRDTPPDKAAQPVPDEDLRHDTPAKVAQPVADDKLRRDTPIRETTEMKKDEILKDMPAPVQREVTKDQFQQNQPIPAAKEVTEDQFQQNKPIPTAKEVTEEQFQDEISAFSSNKPSLTSLAEQHLPIIVPWSADDRIELGTLFHSNRSSTSDPWSKESCFASEPYEACVEEGSSLNMTPRIVYLSAVDGTSGAFRSTKTENTTVKEDHESYGFTATVNLGFCKAVGSLDYDRNLAKNDDDMKTSVRASYRCGTVLIRQTPSISLEAARTLKYKDGIKEFEERYGDYFVFGFNLGGDNTMMASTSTASLSTNERKTMSAQVKSFLLDVEFTQHFDTASFAASASLRVTGYDTLAATTIDRTQKWAESATTSFDQMQRETAAMMQMGHALPSRVEALVNSFGLPIGLQRQRIAQAGKSFRTEFPYEQTVSKEVCNKLLRSGLVVELVLMPVRSLRSVLYWMHEDDII